MSVAIPRNVRQSAPLAAYPASKRSPRNSKIRYLYGVGHGDEDIAKQALNVVAWDLSVPKHKVKVKVDKGWITRAVT
jgi:hypothetical protein